MLPFEQFLAACGAVALTTAIIIVGLYVAGVWRARQSQLDKLESWLVSQDKVNCDLAQRILSLESWRHKGSPIYGTPPVTRRPNTTKPEGGGDE